MKMKVLSLLGPVVEQQEPKVTHKMNLFVSVSGVVEIVVTTTSSFGLVKMYDVKHCCKH